MSIGKVWNSYDEYLQSDEWRVKREWHLQLADYRCQLCGARNAPLHCHHNNYDNIGNELAGDLIALCDECHGEFHHKLPPPPEELLGAQVSSEYELAAGVEKVVRHIVAEPTQ